tara:strand:+ start:1173 stop:1394 length:222 start_codon:yes stop_codon:yes gene_type:complete
MEQEVGRKEFVKFEMLRRSGEINMFDSQRGSILTGLDRSTYESVMDNYEALQSKYGFEVSLMLELAETMGGEE